MSSAVWRLSLAYFFTANEKYAAHAERFLRTWFLDSATAMNPNMKYAQGMKGKFERVGPLE